VLVLALIKFSVFTETVAALCLAHVSFTTQSKPVHPHIFKELPPRHICRRGGTS